MRLLQAYWFWLVLLSLLFVFLERLVPAVRSQRFARPGLVTDLVHITMNGHVWGMLIAVVAAPIAEAFDALGARWGFALQQDWASAWPWAVQLLVAFLVTDFMQWCIHNLLHRVPFLWRFHRVHHSIEVMDFWGSFRFHVAESIVYKSLQYVPLVLLGFDGGALFVIAVVGTAIGHFNHANVRAKLGPLGYVLNGPEMHLWHHAHAAHGPTNVNFGICLSLWDWIFGTGYLPAARPERLGFPGVESFPRDPLSQTLGPFAER